MEKTLPPPVLELLKEVREKDGSDLHLTPGSPPRIRIHGKLVALKRPPLSPADTKKLAYGTMTAAQKSRFEEALDLDFSFTVQGLARFRGNVFTQKGSVSAVFRLIPFEIKSFEELNLPAVLGKLCEKPRGLILITGPAGSGKSTTLAAMIDKMNRDRHQHIITIEDPIEFLHEHKNCVVNQREVHTDTPSFATALRVALREDPDVVLIGEIRDLETIQSALRMAETGHLTLTTLHTHSAHAGIHRIIDVFPAHQQQQIHAQLSLVLQGLLCQNLIPRADDPGRIPATEVLIPNPAIRNLIRENKIHQIYSAMQSGQEKSRMHTMNQSLARLYLDGKISYESCLVRSSRPDELMETLKRSGAKPPEEQEVGTRKLAACAEQERGV